MKLWLTEDLVKFAKQIKEKFCALKRKFIDEEQRVKMFDLSKIRY